ncbi:MAG: ABC transporter ATP-binding protein [Alistipes sp.]|nr:ABC transporter ATP-binding protein [Alistipes sp.]
MSIKSYILTLWKTSHGYRLRIVGSSMAGVAQVCASLMFIWSSKRLVDLATGAAGSSGAAGNTGSSDSSLPLFLGAMIAFMLLQLLFGAISSRLDSLNNVRMDNGLRHDLFGRLMHSTWSGKECYHTGDLINRMEEDTRSVTHTLCSRIPAMVSTLFQGVAAFGFLWMLDARLAWILLLVMPLALGLGKPYMRRMRNLTHTIRTLEGQIQGHLQEHLQHRILLRTLEGVGRSLDALAGLQTTLQRATMRRADFALSSRIAIQVGFAAGYVIAFLWGIFGLQSGAVTFGMMTAFLQLVSQVQRPVVDLSRQIPALAQTFTAVERLSELTALPQEPTGRPIPCQGRLGIRLRGVEFTYPESHRRVIHAFTHDFRPGTMTALVGETGAGKSTLLRLMLGLLRPDEGEVELYNETTAVRVSSLTYGNMVYVVDP